MIESKKWLFLSYVTILCCLYYYISIITHHRPVSEITIALSALPTERYKRNVIRGKLDLVGKNIFEISIGINGDSCINTLIF